jgi:GntP family gluconate:H+ symporter
MLSFAVASIQAPVVGPFLALGAGMVFVMLAIGRWRMPAFFALMFAAILVGLVVAVGGFGQLGLVDAIERPVAEFGSAAGKIAFVIAMAAVIGECLTVSGGAERIVLWLVGSFGEKRAGAALLAAGFILAVPVFFDTVLLLLLPLARALARRTGKDHTFYVLALCGGSMITHTLVPPTPGPLLVAETLRLDLGLTIAAGIACGVLPAWGALGVARWVNRRMPTEPLGGQAVPTHPGGELPSLGLALLPVVAPVLLMALASVTAMLKPAWLAPELARLVAFAGNKHTALLVGMVAALALALRGGGPKWPARLAHLLGAPLENAGVIILITAAGGAFGGMLREAGLAGAVTTLAQGRELNYVLLGWVVAAVVRVAQGSATVAMITATGIVTAIAAPAGWNVHPFWVFAAIGYGAMICSWMNDSGFWLVSRLCGWDERATLRSWTVLASAISLFGLAEVLVLSAVL